MAQTILTVRVPQTLWPSVLHRRSFLNRLVLEMYCGANSARGGQRGLPGSQTAKACSGSRVQSLSRRAEDMAASSLPLHPTPGTARVESVKTPSNPVAGFLPIQP
jgi:hypothetical protein